MSLKGSYQVIDQAFDREVGRLRAQVLLAWEKEARTLRWFGLQDGMSVLELGSGPGFITERLLDLLPNSPVTALEIAPSMLDRARQYLGERDSDRLNLVEASIMDTGLPDDRFDFAIARMLFQHLSDPVGAAVEVRRVLKPGGKLAIIDVDDVVWGLSDPEIPEMGLILERCGQAQAARGGDRLVGRRLWQILASAGFINLDLEAIVAHSDALSLEPFLPLLDLERLSGLVEAEEGLLSETDMAQIRTSREAFLTADSPYILMLILLACGQKPQA